MRQAPTRCGLQEYLGRAGGVSLKHGVVPDLRSDSTPQYGLPLARPRRMLPSIMGQVSRCPAARQER